MSNLVLVALTAAELHELHDAAEALLRGPLGVFPGPDAVARARVTAAMKLLKADADAHGRKFIDLPTLAPFATRVIVEQLAPATADTAPRLPTARPRPAKVSRAARRPRATADRESRGTSDAPRTSSAGGRASSLPED